MAAHTVLAAVRSSVKTSIYDSVLTLKKPRPVSNGDTVKSKCATVMLSSVVFALRFIERGSSSLLALRVLVAEYHLTPARCHVKLFCSIVFKVTLFGGNALLLRPAPPGLQQQIPVRPPVTPLDTSTASFAAAS